MVGLIVFAAIFGVLLIAFVWFYLYSRTLAWGESETRQAVLRMLVVIGPIFGMHYRKPRPEPPTISTPLGEQEKPVPGIVVPPPAKGDEETE
ncbi:MAG: hypothetical protein JOY80_03070 [Candidatus Dormibacteraeota bacterium]|nr:hypothetical protein [Candidatus Dormibacteraeota bacterium]